MEAKRKCFRTSRLSYVVLFFALPGSFLINSYSLHAQILVLNNALLDSSIHHAIQYYTYAIAGSALLYNGSQYRPLELHDYDTGHPYFISDEASTGSVRYDGQHFSNVNILYDITTDNIIIENPYNDTPIELIKDKVGSFSVADHNFVKLSGDSSSQFSVRPGFYDVLYDGGVKVYARRSKEIMRRVENGVEKKKLKEQDRYFIHTKGRFFPVRTKSSVLKVLYERKALLRKELAKNRMAFKKNFEFALSELARVYDESGVTP